jgi:hypothetical protein
MGCSGRVKEADIRPEQKWDFIVWTPDLSAIGNAN